MSHEWMRRARSVAVGSSLLLATLAAGGCGTSTRPPKRLADLRGRIVTDSAVLVIPNRAWRRHPKHDAWTFPTSASLIVQVDRKPERGIRVGVRTLNPAVRPCLTARWDGRDATARETRAEGEILYAFAAAELSPGIHYLTLRNCEHTPPELPAFTAVGYREEGGGTARGAAVGSMQSSRFLSSLVSLGVTGIGDDERLGGFAFDGPGRQPLAVPPESGALSFLVVNGSRGTATFSLTAGRARRELSVDALARQALRLELPVGVDRVELAVQGDPQGAYLWGAPFFETRRADPRPSILLVTLDTTRRDALGAWGAPPHATPALDRLARTSTLFDEAFTTSPWTLPSHASLFTALWPDQHGAGLSSQHLERSAITLAERLTDAGYFTAGVGGGPLTSDATGLAQGFARFHNPGPKTRTATEVTERALTLVAEAPPGPMLLFANYFDPHFPYAAPGRDRGRNGLPEARARAGRADLANRILAAANGGWPLFEQVVRGRARLTESGREVLRGSYAAEVSYMDRELGRLLDGLKASGRFEDAVVAVAADHGELLGEGGYYHHTTRLDPALIEIPMLVRFPGQRQAERVGETVSLLDLHPTLLEAAGLPHPGGPGLSLAPRWREQLRGRRFVQSEEHDSPFHRLFAEMRIADDLWAFHAGGHRRIAWPEGAECAERAERRWRSEPCSPMGFPAQLPALEPGASAGVEERVGLSSGEAERLRALGYLQ